MRRPALVLCALVAVSVIVVPLGAVAQDLGGARDRVASLQDELVEVTDRYEEVVAATEALRSELAELEREEAWLLTLAEDIDARLALRARQVFMHGAGSEFETLLAAEGPNVGVERASFFLTIQQREVADLESAVAVHTRLDQTRRLMAERERELLARTDELAELREMISEDLAAAEQRVAALEALAARQRIIDQGGQRGRYACPISPSISHFIDSWGFPRSGGRSHRGADGRAGVCLHRRGHHPAFQQPARWVDPLPARRRQPGLLLRPPAGVCLGRRGGQPGPSGPADRVQR
jgi:peptidoglycan LD-endopeptidase LytH